MMDSNSRMIDLVATLPLQLAKKGRKCLSLPWYHLNVPDMGEVLIKERDKEFVMIFLGCLHGCILMGPDGVGGDLLY